jgi:hypothetical protein
VSGDEIIFVNQAMRISLTELVSKEELSSAISAALLTGKASESEAAAPTHTVCVFPQFRRSYDRSSVTHRPHRTSGRHRCSCQRDLFILQARNLITVLLCFFFQVCLALLVLPGPAAPLDQQDRQECPAPEAQQGRSDLQVQRGQLVSSDRPDPTGYRACQAPMACKVGWVGVRKRCVYVSH